MSAFYNVDQPPFNSRSSARAIAAANNGLLFDIGDMSTMFQDAAGTTPVTAVEQPVGKMLDKSGNNWHATQSVTASRPVLSARHNLLTKTEDFADAAWVKTNATVESSEILNPYGRNANKLIATQATGVHQIQQDGSQLLLNKSFTVCAKSGEYTQISVSISNNPYDANELVISLADGSVIRKGSVISSVEIKSHPDGWYSITVRYSITVHYGPIGDFRCSIGVVSGGATNFTGDGTSGLYVSCAQEEHNQAALPYQRVNTATDYDTDPRYFPKYLRFDGVDDYLNLPYMGLYTGGEMSIIAARNAVSQSTDTYVISERSTTDADPKYFPSRQLASGGNIDAYIADDNAAVVLDTVGSPFSGADNAVIRSVVDSGNNLKLFKNCVLAANDNYTRSGTLTLNNTTIGASVSTTTSNYASMKLYGLIITKSALIDSQRIACERHLSRKSGVLL